jgi:hypothetical protein
MPLLQYFGWVGSFLFAALLAANWWCSAPIAPAQVSDVPLNQTINIRIRTDHKWPERVVFDTTRSSLAPEATVELEALAPAAHQPFDAFAEMAGIPARPCFRPPCSTGQATDRQASPARKGTPPQNHSRMAARKGLTFPSPLHKPPGRS